MIHWEDWKDYIDSAKTPADMLKRYKRLTVQIHAYCHDQYKDFYRIATRSPEYHGAKTHLGKTEADMVTRMIDDNGKNLAFNHDMTKNELRYNTMNAIYNNSDWIISMFTKDEYKDINRMRMIVSVTPDKDKYPDGYIGKGIKVRGKGKNKRMVEYDTNMQTIIIERVSAKGLDKKYRDNNPLGIRIITEYPCIMSEDYLKKIQKMPDHIDYDKATAARQITVADDAVINGHISRGRPVDKDVAVCGIRQSKFHKRKSAAYDNVHTSPGIRAKAFYDETKRLDRYGIGNYVPLPEKQDDDEI